MKNYRLISRSLICIIVILSIAAALSGCGGGLRNYAVVTESSVADSSDSKSATAACPAGLVATGGGARIFGQVNNIALSANGPEGDPDAPTEWFGSAAGITSTTQEWGLRVDVVCAMK